MLDPLKMEFDQIEALGKFISLMISQWEKSGIKQATEFDTLWGIAEREGAKRLKNDLIRNLYDKHKEKFPARGQE